MRYRIVMLTLLSLTRWSVAQTVLPSPEDYRVSAEALRDLFVQGVASPVVFRGTPLGLEDGKHQNTSFRLIMGYELSYSFQYQPIHPRIVDALGVYGVAPEDVPRELTYHRLGLAKAYSTHAQWELQGFYSPDQNIYGGTAMLSYNILRWNPWFYSLVSLGGYYGESPDYFSSWGGVAQWRQSIRMGRLDFYGGVQWIWAIHSFVNEPGTFQFINMRYKSWEQDRPDAFVGVAIPITRLRTFLGLNLSYGTHWSAMLTLSYRRRTQLEFMDYDPLPDWVW